MFKIKRNKSQMVFVVKRENNDDTIFSCSEQNTLMINKK